MSYLNHRILLWLTVFLFFLVLSSRGQRPHLHGRVLNSETKAAVSNANVVIRGTKSGTLCDTAGNFTVFTNTSKECLIVSHIGYETQKVWFEDLKTPVIVYLKPESHLLSGVEVKEKNESEHFFRDTKYSVLDYATLDHQVYLLIYRFRLSRSEILVRSETGETVARSEQLNFKPTGFFRDCMQTLHVMSEDSVYQVDRQGASVKLYYPAEISNFIAIMKDCITSTESTLYFRQLSQNQQRVNFYSIDRKTKSRTAIASVTDEEKLRLLRDNPYDRYLLTCDTIPTNESQFRQWMWLRKVLYKPNSSSLYRIDDKLLVLNTVDISLESYNLDGEFLTRQKIPVKTVPGQWTMEMYIDDIDHQAYTSFIKNGQYTLYRIDQGSGELKRTLVIGEIFPQKISIHNRNLYYLYITPGSGENKHLYQQKF
ncbi:MAG: carboxypeptidase-like regulatory domain-containing protein [Bacteroidetes bacterium]|nr:carboxypeptidase-like regulatory domain-containing protein [Bacteroidota bacterium]